MWFVRNRINFHYNKRQIISSGPIKILLSNIQYIYPTASPPNKMTPNDAYAKRKDIYTIITFLV